MLRGGTLRACAMAGTAVFRIVVSSDSMKNPTATSQGRRRLAVAVSVRFSRACKAGSRASRDCERRIHDALRLGEQPGQMRGVVKTLGVDLVVVFRPRWARGYPPAARGDLHAADRCIIAGRTRQNLIDGLAGELRDPYLRSIELAELLLLFGVRGSVHAAGEYRAQFLGERAIRSARIAAGARRD